MVNIPRIEDIDEDEQKLCQIHKHPFGLISVYFEIAVGLLAVLAVSYFLLPSVLSSGSSGEVSGIVTAAAILFAFIGWAGLTAFTYIYNRNFLIISDRNVTQVLQQGLFNRKVSELSLANVEDVSAIRKGIFATMFNFGTLQVETAGEAENFVFGYCPNPNYYGKVILDARREFVNTNRNRRERRELVD